MRRAKCHADSSRRCLVAIHPFRTCKCHLRIFTIQCIATLSLWERNQAVHCRGLMMLRLWPSCWWIGHVHFAIVETHKSVQSLWVRIVPSRWCMGQSYIFDINISLETTCYMITILIILWTTRGSRMQWLVHHICVRQVLFIFRSFTWSDCHIIGHCFIMLIQSFFKGTTTSFTYITSQLQCLHAFFIACLCIKLLFHLFWIYEYIRGYLCFLHLFERTGWFARCILVIMVGVCIIFLARICFSLCCFLGFYWNLWWIIAASITSNISFIVSSDVNGRQHYQDFLSLQDSTHPHFRTWFRFTRQRLGVFVVICYREIR